MKKKHVFIFENIFPNNEKFWTNWIEEEKAIHVINNRKNFLIVYHKHVKCSFKIVKMQKRFTTSLTYK